MKQLKVLTIVLTATLAFGASIGTLFAEDPLKAAPTMYKMIYENDRVRVLEVTFKPGEKIASHSHPDHYVYVLQGGMLKITKADGTSIDADLKVGDVVWIPAETHWAESKSAGTIRLLVNELKEQKPAGSAPAKTPTKK